jgi:hypothetical protein
MFSSLLRTVALFGFNSLKKNLEFSVDTVQKKGGLFIHVEVIAYDRVLINEYVPLLKGGNDSEILRKNPVDYNAAGAKKLINNTLNELRK